MTKLINIRIPMIVTEDGKWAASGSHTSDTKDPDWSNVDEMCDWENPTINPKRYWIETVVEIPETRTVSGTTIPEQTDAKVTT